MGRVFTIGESVYDIMIQSDQITGGCPGGAMLNVAVSCARTGLETYIITEYGNDILGNQIETFLNRNNVNTKFAYRFDSGKTPIAIAGIKDDAKADYDFYKNYPENRLVTELPEFSEDDILVFGSIYSLTPELYDKISRILKTARKNGVMIIYDPNIRKNAADNSEILHQAIKYFRKCDIVKGSDEDFVNIFGTKDSQTTYRNLRENAVTLIYTMGNNGVHLEASNTFSKFPATKLIPVNTIGAGDAFTAGLIYAFQKNGITRKELRKLDYKSWKEIIPVAIEFASDVCMSAENYISEIFAAKLT